MFQNLFSDKFKLAFLVAAVLLAWVAVLQLCSSPSSPWTWNG
jgi:nucleoside permease NupC